MAVTEHHGRGSGGKRAVMLLLRGKQTACPELLPGPRAGQEDGWRPHSLLAGRQNFNPLWPQYKCGEGKDVCGMVGGGRPIR